MIARPEAEDGLKKIAYRWESYLPFKMVASIIFGFNIFTVSRVPWKKRGWLIFLNKITTEPIFNHTLCGGIPCYSNAFKNGNNWQCCLQQWFSPTTMTATSPLVGALKRLFQKSLFWEFSCITMTMQVHICMHCSIIAIYCAIQIRLTDSAKTDVCFHFLDHHLQQNDVVLSPHVSILV